MSITTNTYLEKKADEFNMEITVSNIAALTSLLPNANYILNLGNNSHWVALMTTENSVYYCDSFGCPPPTKIIELIQNLVVRYSRDFGYHYNKNTIQNLQSGYCGEYAWLFLYFMNRGNKPLKSRFLSYQKLFKDDPEKNKTILLEYLHKIHFFN